VTQVVRSIHSKTSRKKNFYFRLSFFFAITIFAVSRAPASLIVHNSATIGAQQNAYFQTKKTEIIVNTK